MAVTYGFYDSLNHDRLYNAQQMSAIFDGIINDGVFMSVGNQFHTVAGTGMQVIVKSGRAWFDSTWTLNDAEYPLSIDAADVLLTRIDAVVLEVNSEVATRANTIKVVKGTPASTPAKPTLTNTATVHQHALAYVTVAKNTTAITNSMIEIVVGKTETPYVTAILQTTDITDLFKKWENDFQVWFETVKGTLDGDVALNLQNQIDHCVKKADKATSADIDAGTADKWVDAASIGSNILSLGNVIQDYTDTLLTNENYGLISNKTISLKNNEYSTLFNKIKYKYGCYYDDFYKVTRDADISSSSDRPDLQYVTMFRVLVYNGHVYTLTRVCYSGTSANSYSDVIMKDNQVLETKTTISSSNVSNYCTFFVYNNRFYKITADYSSHYISCSYWDASNESWTAIPGLYLNNYENQRSAQELGRMDSNNCTTIICKNNNVYCHIIAYVYSSTTYRTLITITGSSSISIQTFNNNQIYLTIYDNEILYGVNRDATIYYVINSTTGEANSVTNIPEHVKTIFNRYISDRTDSNKSSSEKITQLNTICRNTTGTEYVLGNLHELYDKKLYVKYINNTAYLTEIDVSQMFKMDNANSTVYTTFYSLYHLIISYRSNNSSGDHDYSNIEGDPIDLKFYSKYYSNASYVHDSMLLFDELPLGINIYIPVEVNFYDPTNTNKVTISIRKYDSNYFNANYITTQRHTYMKLR